LPKLFYREIGFSFIFLELDYHFWLLLSTFFLLTFNISGVYQLLAFQRVSLLDALLVALILGLLPYVLVRGPANRLSRYLRSRRPWVLPGVKVKPAPGRHGSERIYDGRAVFPLGNL
jgi:hypothetical protein